MGAACFRRCCSCRCWPAWCRKPARRTLPVITIASGAAITEGGNAEFTLTANPAPTANLSVKVDVTDVFGIGRVLLPGNKGERTVTILAGQTTATFTVPTDDDDIDEGSGDVAVTVLADTGYTIGTPSSRWVLVMDNDDPVVSLDAASYNVTEGEGVSVTLNFRDRARGVATTVGIACTAGTAGSADFTCPASVTIPRHVRTHTFTIQATQDTVSEFPETFTVAIDTVPTGVRKGTPSSATVNIFGGKSRGNFYFKAWPGAVIDGETGISSIASSGHVNEGSSITYTVLRGQQFGAASVDYRTMDISAEAPGDYTHVSGTLHWTHRDTDAKTITIQTVCDNVKHEGAEQFWLILSNPTGGYSLTSTNRYYPHKSRVVIRTVPCTSTSGQRKLTVPEVTISADRTSVTEGGDVTFTVTADPAPQLALTVNVGHFEEMGDGLEYRGQGGTDTVTIPAGQTAASWTVTTMSNDVALADGTVVGNIKAGDNYTVGTPSEVTVTLLDDDGVVTQNVPDSVVTDPVTPGVDPALVAQVRGYAAETHEGQAHVDRWKRVLAAFGDDNGYTPMTAAAAQTYADKGWQRWVPVVAALEALEAAQQPLTLPAVSVAAGADVTEGGDAVFTVTASPAPAAPLAVTVTVATAGEFGVTAGSRPVTIPVTGSATLTLATANDGADEPDGSVSVTVAAGDGYTVGGPAAGTVAIADDDPAPVVATADPALVAQVRGYAAETHHGQAHVDRWRRVLAAFGDDNGYTPMTAAAAQTYADKGWQRWVPVVAALKALEAAQQPLTLPAVTVSAGADVTEGGDAVFTVTASPAPAAALAVTVSVATAGEFGITAGTQTVSIPTTGSATLTLTTTNDDADEPDGSVNVTVAAGDGYTVGDPAAGTVVVRDDDAPLPAITVSAGDAVTEGADATFTVTASPAPGLAAGGNGNRGHRGRVRHNRGQPIGDHPGDGQRHADAGDGGRRRRRGGRLGERDGERGRRLHGGFPRVGQRGHRGRRPAAAGGLDRGDGGLGDGGWRSRLHAHGRPRTGCRPDSDARGRGDRGRRPCGGGRRGAGHGGHRQGHHDGGLLHRHGG